MIFGANASDLINSGFSHAPGHQRGRSVFSYHYYCQTFDNLKELCDHIVSPEIFRAVLENARAFSGSTFLTEFGGLDSAANLAEGAKIMSFADENFQSWTEVRVALCSSARMHMHSQTAL